MKLVCSQSDLIRNLSLVSRAVPSKPTHPVLANIKVEANEEKNLISLTAFDLSMGIKTSFSAEVNEGGELALPAKLLTDIISRLPDGEITLDVDEEEPICTLKYSKGRYQVRGVGTDEFPELPVIELGQKIKLPISALMAGLKGSLFATSADESKQVLTGVHLIIKSGTLEFAATDGHRLSVVENSAQNEDENESEIDNIDDEFKVTVPAKALRELEKMISMQPDAKSITLHGDEGQIIFTLGSEESDKAQILTCRALDSQYPNYRNLIPNEFEKQVTVDRKELISSLERIAVLTDQKNSLVKFTLDGENQQMFLSVDTQDVGSGKEDLSAQISGEDMEIAFNVKYMLEGLKAFPSTEIQLQLNSPSAPAIITPLSGLRMTYLLMPVHIRK